MTATYTFGRLGGRATGLDRLLRGTADLIDRTGRRAARPESLLTDLADGIYRLPDRAAGTERLLRGVTDVIHGRVHRVQQGLQYLRVAVQRRQGSVQDVVEVLQPHLEQGLRVNVLDVEFHFADVYMDAGNDLHQVRDLGSQGQVRIQVLDVEVDLPDVDLGNIDEDVGLIARIAAL